MRASRLNRRLALSTACLCMSLYASGVEVPLAPFPGQKSLFSETNDMYKDGETIVVVPKTVAKGKPWVWRARFWGHEPQFDVAMLELGYHVVYCDVGGLLGNPTAEARYKQMGGIMEVIHKAETGHHPHSLKDPTPIVQFIQKHCGG